MANDLVVQYSVDIVYDGYMGDDTISEMLEERGLTVLGCQWKATWTKSDYKQGKEPFTSD